MAANRLITALALVLLTTCGAAAQWDAGGGPKWEATLAAARQEGSVVGALCDTLSDPLAKAFTADTGIEMSLVPGNTQDLSNRYRAELRSGRVTIDVRTAGASDIELAKDGLLLDLSQILILPEVTDAGGWKDGDIGWVDNDHKYMPDPVDYVSTRPMINTDIIPRGTIKNWTDLLKPEYKGKIAASDPTVVGSGQTFGAYLAYVHGIDFVVQLFNDQDVAITRDSRQLGEWAGRGLYPIALGMDALYYDRLRDQGLTSLEWVTPEDGPGSLVGGCAVLNIPKEAPHPNAAIVFANWYLSKRGQEALEEIAHYPSRRTDISHGHASAHFTPDPARSYLNQYREDWHLHDLLEIRAQLKDRLKQFVGN